MLIRRVWRFESSSQHLKIKGDVKVRDIKFRAWDSKKKTIINKAEHNMGDDNTYDIEIAIALDGSIRYCDFEMYYPSIGFALDDKTDHYIFMQYTGLKDKHGKEIYEGDILDVLGYKCEVMFEDGCYFYVDTMNRWLKPMGLCTGNCEPSKNIIIGNIYENPELM